ncbi:MULTISPECIES: TolB family protein [Saccharothrix]|uniref:TolB family protein n=1 Tax=Saccharothrix TaxID=2071 RepID=UPI0009401EC3|nr:PD40 domain-containing protein [Saccharothrix sp. CB00851]
MTEYRDFAPRQRFRSNVALSPDGTSVAYAANSDGQHNLYVAPVSGGPARRITDYTEHAVRQVAWSPNGRELLYTADFRGNEKFQLYLVDAEGGTPRQLTDAPDSQHVLGSSIFTFDCPTPFSPDGRSVVYAGNDRDPAVQDVLVQDLETGSVRRVESVAGTLLHAVSVSPDSRWLLTAGKHTNTDTDLGLVDLHEPDAPRRVVTEDAAGRMHVGGPWAADSSGFLLLHDRGGEFRALGSYSLAAGVVEDLVTPPWDVEAVAVSGAVRTWTVNEDGVSRLFVLRDGEPVTLPELPAGVVESLTAVGDVVANTRPTPCMGSTPSASVAPPGCHNPHPPVEPVFPPGEPAGPHPHRGFPAGLPLRHPLSSYLVSRKSRSASSRSPSVGAWSNFLAAL